MRQQRWTIAVIVAMLVSTVSLGAGWAADASDPLPTAVADIQHALRSVDHVIVYRDAPSPVIEEVLIHGRRENAAAGADVPVTATDPVGVSAARRVDPASAGLPTGWADSSPSAVVPGSPVEPIAPQATGATAPPAATAVGPAFGDTDRPWTPGPVATGGRAVTPGGVVSDLVARQILDRVEELVEATREATLGATRTPGR